MVGVYVSELKTFVEKSVVKNLVTGSLSMGKWEARHASTRGGRHSHYFEIFINSARS